MAVKTLIPLRSFSTLILAIVLLSTTFLVPCSSDQTTNLISCLTRQNISNITIHPCLNHSDLTSNYFKLLNFSIQNLRFALPSVAKPTAIIVPSSRDQLMNTVLCCKNEFWEFRVRCGGHSYEGTSSVVGDEAPFVIIDMMNLDKVSIDIEEGTAWVEGGATLGQTYHAISQSSDSRGFSAGSCPTVGIGGHISGGGFGLLSRKYGLAADNVIDALLVDADGRLLDRESMGEEVFWAIRGGGGGIWGIIFAWKIKLLEVPKVVTGFIVSRPGANDHIAKLVHKWQFVAPKLDDEFYMSVFVGAGLPEAHTIGDISATFKGFYLGPKRDVLSMMEEAFPEIGITGEDCTEMTWIESIVFFSGLGEGSTISDLMDRYLHVKGYFKAKSDYVRKEIPPSGINSMLDILKNQPKGYVIMDPYGGIMDKISSDLTPFPHRKGNLFTIQYLVEWKEDKNQRSKEYLEWIRAFYDSMTQYVSRGPRAAYINYVDLDLGVIEGDGVLRTNIDVGAPTPDAVEEARVWGQKYFLQNYDRLVRAKTIIDPQNVFKNQQGIPPMSTTKANDNQVFVSEMK